MLELGLETSRVVLMQWTNQGSIIIRMFDSSQYDQLLQSSEDMSVQPASSIACSQAHTNAVLAVTRHMLP